MASAALLGGTGPAGAEEATSLPPPSPWQVSETVEALTGAKTITAVLLSDAPIANMVGNPDHPALLLRCRENIFAAYIACRMTLADGSMAVFDTARTGRMGELVVEFELLRRGWLCGNFNHTVLNSAGWDLFATRGTRSVRIRVKARRPGVDCFRWSAKADGSIFSGLDPAAPDDFVAAVSFEADGRYDVHILPSAVVETTLRTENDRWLSGAKANGELRKPTSMRHIYLRGPSRP